MQLQKNGSDALGLNKGQLQKDKDADIISLLLPNEVKDESDLCMNVILHTKFVEKNYYRRKRCLN